MLVGSILFVTWPQIYKNSYCLSCSRNIAFSVEKEISAYIDKSSSGKAKWLMDSFLGFYILYDFWCSCNKLSTYCRCAARFQLSRSSGCLCDVFCKKSILSFDNRLVSGVYRKRIWSLCLSEVGLTNRCFRSNCFRSYTIDMCGYKNVDILPKKISAVGSVTIA